MTRILLTATTLALLLGGPNMVSADVLILRDDTKLEGRVEDVPGKPTRIALITGSGRIEIPRDRVKELVEEPDSADYRRIGSQLLALRNFPSAAENFRKSLGFDPEDREAREGLARAEEALGAQAELHAQEHAAEVETLLTQARAAIEKEDFEGARKILERVAAANTSEEQRTAAQRTLIDLYNAWGYHRLDRLDARGAEENFTRVLEIDPENDIAREHLLTVWEKNPAKREEVLKAYLQKLRDDPDNLELNAKTVDVLVALNRYEEAVPYLEKLFGSPNYRARNYGRQFQIALQETVRFHRDAGNWDTSISYTQKLLGFFPSEDPTQLVLLQYRKALAGIAADDMNGRAALIKQLGDNGLNDLAYAEADVAIQRSPDQPILKAILRERAERDLADVRDYLNAGDFAVARDLARSFINQNASQEDLVTQASEIYERASVEFERQQKQRKEMAREIGQRGIEYLSQARSFAEQLRRSDVIGGAQPYSAKQEAIKFSRRAIDTMQTSISMDPTLGGVTGLDLNAHLNDARSLLSSLTSSPNLPPRYQYLPYTDQIRRNNTNSP